MKKLFNSEITWETASYLSAKAEAITWQFGTLALQRSAQSAQVNPEKVPLDCIAAREEQHVCFNNHGHKLKNSSQGNFKTKGPESQERRSEQPR